jgi:hypothetical protein
VSEVVEGSGESDDLVIETTLRWKSSLSQGRVSRREKLLAAKGECREKALNRKER